LKNGSETTKPKTKPQNMRKIKKEKQKAAYGGNPRENERAYDRSGRPPRGAYSNYAPLTMPPSRVYKEIMYSELKDRPLP
jgi:hypothetical protein